ncbi:trichohyalin [Triplophysa rosa]|uniref:Trichohyalin-like n=1 Tax=Triplophysa rosa TaxID=992332 RepID=A0A9W7TGH8_TRIRA|nr:trichohyalin [Triplophysa rosa]KAI7796043.1 putative trichohyalin-like [Triplophysa rosa]
MKSMREINLDTYSLSLLTAKEDILNPRSSTNWALFAYDGIMNRLKLADSGVGGLKELMTKLHPRRSLYGMCRVGTKQSLIVMILWVGIEVDEYRRAECASHLPAIRAFFREVQIFLPAHTLDEMTEERMCTLASKAAMVMQGPRQRPGLRREDRQETVGTNYKRTIAAAETLRIQRESFWAQAEREEDERRKEEQQRAAEDRRQREIERLRQERREAMERKRKMMEREQKIKEQRRIQAQMEAEERKRERIKWKCQEREREDEEARARYLRSESEEKAAEAAALVSQRTTNPREFFRQLSSSSIVNSDSQTSSPYPVRNPYRRLHHSQTDNVFIFNEPSSFTPPSPHRSTAASPYLPSTPTSKSPTLVFPSSLHSPEMVSPTISKQNIPQDCAMVPSRSQIYLSSPQQTESSYKVTAYAMPPSILQLQAKPSASMNAESEIKKTITAILDSLVFYPPPPTKEELRLDNRGLDEAKPTDKLSSPLSHFEFSPKPSEDFSETSMQTQPDVNLSCQSVSDALTSSPSQSSPVSLVPSCLLVPQPPSRPLPALPISPPTLKDLESDRDFPASVRSMVEEEEIEGEDGETVEKEWIHEETVREIRDEENEAVEEGKGGEMREDREEMNAGQEEPDGKNMEKHDDKNALEETESEYVQDGKNIDKSETEKTQRGQIMKECEKANKIMEESENGKEPNETIMEDSESMKYQDGEILEESESEKNQEEKIVEEANEKYQDKKIVQESESEKYQDVKIEENVHDQEEKILEESKSEIYQEDKIMEECDGEKYQEVNILQEFECDKYEDEKIMEESKNEKYQEQKIEEEFKNIKYQDEKTMEESETDKCQEEKIEEESDNEKYENEKIVEESENVKDQDEKMMEESQSEKYQDEKIEEESENVQEQDEKMMEESESEKYQEAKIMEECGGEKYQEVKILQEFESEKCKDEKIREESKSEKCKEEKITEESDTEKYQEQKIEVESKYAKDQDEKMMEESKSEKGQEEKIKNETEYIKYQDIRTMEEFENENEQKSIENCDSDGKEKDNFQEEYEEALMNQENEEKSSKDFTRTENLTVLKAESDTEIIMIHDTTDEGGVKRTSDQRNEKKERNIPLIKTDEEDPSNADKQNEHEPCAETLFSQHAPLFPESSAARPSQYISLAESIPNHNENEPQMISTDSIQDKSDLSHQEDPKVTTDSLTAVSFSQESLHLPSKNSSGSEENALSTSAISEQASFGQSDGEEGLE